MQLPDAFLKFCWIGLGGILGANARYWLGLWLSNRFGTAFPWATFVINVSGAFILGFFVALMTGRIETPNAPALRLLIATGFLGAYTTFSTFEYETLALVHTASLFRAFANAFGSLVAGFAAVWLGEVLAKMIWRSA